VHEMSVVVRVLSHYRYTPKHIAILIPN